MTIVIVNKLQKLIQAARMRSDVEYVLLSRGYEFHLKAYACQ